VALEPFFRPNHVLPELTRLPNVAQLARIRRVLAFPHQIRKIGQTDTPNIEPQLKSRSSKSTNVGARCVIHGNAKTRKTVLNKAVPRARSVSPQAIATETDEKYHPNKYTEN